MKEEYLYYPVNYFTATINEWKPVLANDNYNDQNQDNADYTNN